MDAESEDGSKRVRHVIRPGYKLPEVIVLAMNFHGFIEIEMPDLTKTSKLRDPVRLDDILRPNHIGQIPDGITLVKMNAVALGVSNYLSATEVRQEIDIIIRELDNPPFKNIENGTEKNVDVCKHFADSVAMNMKQQIFMNITGNTDTTRLTRENIDAYIKLGKSDSTSDSESDSTSDSEQRYAYFDQLMSDFSYTSKIYRPRDLYTDKVYTRETIIAKRFNIQASGELQCRAMNMRGHIDIVDFLFPDLRVSQGSLIKDDNTIYLSSIIDGLKAYGVKIIIFLDSTCSVLGSLITGHQLGKEYPENRNIYRIADLGQRLLRDNPENFPGGSRNKKTSKKIGKKKKHSKR